MCNTEERRALCGICPAGCWVVVRYNKDGRIAAGCAPMILQL